MKPSVRIFAATLLGCGLIGAGWWLGRQGELSALAGSPVAADSAKASGEVAIDDLASAPEVGIAAPETGAAETVAEAPAMAPEPLPAIDLPLGSVFDALVERARRGDANAACRLAVDLKLCRDSTMNAMRRNSMERFAVAEDNSQTRDRIIERMAHMDSSAERAGQICADLAPAQLEQAFDFQLQAAAARPELRMWAITQPALDSQLFLTHIDRWQRYRQVAMPWLEQAAADGDLTAIVLLARIHGDDRVPSPPVPPFRQIDAARFVTYAELMQRYGLTLPPVQAAADARRQQLSPAALDIALRQADALFRADREPIATPQEAQAVMRRSFEPAMKAEDCE